MLGVLRKKMLILEKYFNDPDHTFDSTYMLSLQDCDVKGCKFGCRGWTGMPSKVKNLIRAVPVLPMSNPNNPGHMYSYDDAKELVGGTDERDLPSKKHLGGEEMKQRKLKDKDKELHPSKVRFFTQLHTHTFTHSHTRHTHTYIYIYIYYYII